MPLEAATGGGPGELGVSTRLPRVLFVDDEAHLLQGIARQVRGLVHAELATSGEIASGLLEQASAQGCEFAVVVSDMRMPGTDGVALLKHARRVSPETTRILLTGFADLESAVAAVNDGNIFRFLTKPCDTAGLHAALSAGIELHTLVRDRRELLERTLRGAVQALIDTLAMAQPEAFTRASRLGRLTSEVAAQLRLPEAWQVEIAAQLGEIGVVTLPQEALNALVCGHAPNAAIGRMLDALPELADSVLGRIPKLESVRAIVRAQQPVDHPDPLRLAEADRASRLLQTVREYDSLTARSFAPEHALATLRQRGHHPVEVLEALQRVVVTDAAFDSVELEVEELAVGMVMAADLRSTTGILLARYGQVLTEQTLARISNFARIYGLQAKPEVRH